MTNTKFITPNLDFYFKKSLGIGLVKSNLESNSLLNSRLGGKRIWVSSSRFGQMIINNREKKEQIARKFNYSTKQIYCLDEIVLLFKLTKQETDLFSQGEKP